MGIEIRHRRTCHSLQTHVGFQQYIPGRVGLGWVRGLFLGGGLLALEVGLAPFAFDNFVVLFAHDV